LNGDDADDVAKLLDASAWRRVDWSGGARSSMAMVVFSTVFSMGSLQIRRSTRLGEEWWRREREWRRARVFPRIPSGLAKRRRRFGVGCSVTSAERGHAPLVLFWRRLQGRKAYRFALKK
jgi:hypothetical protein